MKVAVLSTRKARKAIMAALGATQATLTLLGYDTAAAIVGTWTAVAAVYLVTNDRA